MKSGPTDIYIFVLYHYLPPHIVQNIRNVSSHSAFLLIRCLFFNRILIAGVLNV